MVSDDDLPAGWREFLDSLALAGRPGGRWIADIPHGNPREAVLRRRFKRTAAAAGLRVLRFHSLRHGAGSLVARQADAPWVQGFLDHSRLAATERYLHAKARPEDVERLNRAFAIGGHATSDLATDPAHTRASFGYASTRWESRWSRGHGFCGSSERLISPVS
jgi:hypothetical protein